MSATRRASATPRKPTAAQRAAYAAKLQAALAWPSFPEPQPLDDAERDSLLASVRESQKTALVVAWTYNAYAHEVLKGCFSGNQHSTRSHTRTTTQGSGGPWFVTRKDAAEALAWEIARNCARTMLHATSYIEQQRSHAPEAE